MENGTTQASGEWTHTDSSHPPLTCRRISRMLKGEGRHALLGHLSTAIGANTLYFVIVIVVNFLINGMLDQTTLFSLLLTELLSILAGILIGILEYGLVTIYMNLQYGQLTKFTDLFAGFRENSNKIIIIEAVLIIAQTLCTLPAMLVALFVPGFTGLIVMIVLYIIGLIAEYFIIFTYALTLYILLDYPDMEVRAVFEKSRSLMKGHKKHMLYIEVSFLPLYALSALSFGIAAIPLFAYEQSTFAAFYRKRMEGALEKTAA